MNLVDQKGSGYRRYDLFCIESGQMEETGIPYGAELGAMDRNKNTFHLTLKHKYTKICLFVKLYKRVICGTHSFDGVGDQRGRLAICLGEVVREPLVLCLLAAELHELALHQVRHHLQVDNTFVQFNLFQTCCLC